MSIRVLVVDDSNFFRRCIGEIITAAADMEVIDYAKNGREGVDKAIALSPDVVMMDIEMPVMDGYVATTSIRAMEAEQSSQPHCWIIGLSAHATGDYVQKARDAGMDDYLSKPVAQQQVSEAIKRAQLSRSNDVSA